ncbi:unnamed protein product [Vitrella brassicaformis CCMP3155]|uniref:Major facilitator superfamily (MFS) profile domain-containing protein n=2 Tax=Vitrella brassicaformis TaxID=1169539 RepID=A0A0G4EZW8_VITBC|nr:unnamed protein product [Vitrella brassicaformis CCMP3155]|eukprot:CEM04379.1 unnamed protein product [Vitrella brassicaformis CCMP3155]
MSVKSSVNEFIEAIGFGLGQIVAILSGGGAYLADGAEVLVLGAINYHLGQDLGLSGVAMAAMVSIIFVGVMCGNLLAGVIGDHYGRKLPILLSYSGTVSCSLVSIMLSSYWLMMVCRFLVGISFGIGVPAWNSLSGEITPIRWRLLAQSISQSLFCFGEIYAASTLWFLDPQLKHADWRILVAVASIPSFLFLFSALLLLTESPHFLYTQNKLSATRDVLMRLAWWNRKDIDVQLLQAPMSPLVRQQSAGVDKTFRQELRSHLKIIFSRKYLFSTLVCCFVCYVVNTGFYGLLYALPLTVPHMEPMGTTPAGAVLGAAMFELLGYPAVFFFDTFCTRIANIASCSLCVGLSLTIFCVAAFLHQTTIALWSVSVAKLFVVAVFVTVYVYVVELYPTICRTMGTALCFTAGRLGAISSPLTFELFRLMVIGEREPSVPGEPHLAFMPFFILIATLNFITACLTAFLPYETKGAPLQAFHEPHEADERQVRRAIGFNGGQTDESRALLGPHFGHLQAAAQQQQQQHADAVIERAG